MTSENTPYGYQITPLKHWTANDYADFYSFEWFVNVLPADTGNPDKTKRKPKDLDICGNAWKQWKDCAIPREIHEQWKKRGSFEKWGIAVICGRCWRFPGKKKMFFNGIDNDNKVATDEMWKPGLEEKTIIEQHVGNLDKSHIIVITEDRPMHPRNADEDGLASRGFDKDKVPLIEVQSDGKLLFVTPSPHRDGSNYGIVGTEKIVNIPVEDAEKWVDDTCEKYDQHYLKSIATNITPAQSAERINNLQFKTEGTNRQLELISIGNRYAIKNKGEVDEDNVVDYVIGLNNKMRDPYPERRAIEIGKDCFKFSFKVESDPEIEIKMKMKANWNMLRETKPGDDKNIEAKENINELQKELGEEITKWDEPPTPKPLETKDEEEKPDSAIYNKALDLAEEFDHSESLKQLTEYNQTLENPYTDVKVKKFLSLAEKKIKYVMNKQFAPKKEHESPKQIRAYQTGELLIQERIQNESDLEQIVVKVYLNGKPVWVDLFSSSFEQLLRVTIHNAYDSIYGESVFRDAIKALHAQAMLGGTERKKIYKTCAMENGKIHYNTNDDDGSIYEISKEEIKKLSDNDPQPIFLKQQNMKAKVNRDVIFDNPFAIRNFSRLCRIQPQDRIVFEVHVFCEFLKNIPIAAMIVHGEQGAAKTSVSTGVKYVVDPEVENSLSMPTDPEDLVVAMSKREMSSFDNIDSFGKIVSDLLCRAVTGTMQSKRKLYTNSDSYDVYLKEKIILNGITPSVDQPDLVQRSIFYELLKIDEKDRLTDKIFLERLDGLRPYVVGQALQTIQKAMVIIEDVNEEIKQKLPRMADFAVWGETISRVLGNKDNSFLNAYKERLIESNLGLSQEYPVIKPLMSLVSDSVAVFTRGLSELYDLIAPEDQYGRRNSNMPKDLSLFGKELKKITPVIRSMGYELTSNVYNKKDGVHTRGSKVVTISRISETDGALNGYF